MKVFLAGDDVAPYKALIGKFHPYSLFSYHYFRKCSDNIRKMTVDIFNEHNVELICDSGLFTFMFGSGKKAEGNVKSVNYWLDYTHQYLEQAKSWGFKQITVVECDTHKVAGMDVTFRLREEFQKSGLPTMYVWHIEEGIPGLEAMARQYDYIGISVLELKKLFKGHPVNWKVATRDLIYRIQQSAGRLPKIHLLGNTTQELLKCHLVYSCDSTSWLSGPRFGNAQIFYLDELKTISINGNLFKQMSMNAKATCGPYFEQVNAYYAELGRKVPKSAPERIVCAWQWALYQQFLDRKFQWIGDQT